MNATAQSYPEHEKLSAISELSQAIGEFIETSPYTLCTLREAGDNGEQPYVWQRDEEWRRDRGIKRRHPLRSDYLRGWADTNPAFESWRTEFVPVGRPINELLADYFGIDLRKIEQEKRAMLDAMREANSGA
jgi:hypothetical protein